MQFIKTRGVLALLAATVAAIFLVPVATAGAHGPAAAGSAKKSAKNRVKALEKKVGALSKQSAALARQSAQMAELSAALAKQVAALQAGQATLEGRKFPTSLPPSGPAGGDLTGTYPKPTLGPDTVGSPNILDNSIQSADIFDGAIQSVDILDGTIQSGDIFDGAIQSADILDNSVQSADILNGTIQSADLAGGILGAGALRGVEPVFGQGVHISPGETPKEATVTCPAGERLLSGGFEWSPSAKRGDIVMSSSPSFVGDPRVTWAALGRVESNGDANTLFAEALCLVS